MTEEIKNDIDKLDGMIKIKGKCGYEIIGGCSDLRRLEQENRELKAYKDVNEDFKKAWDELNKKYTEVLKLAKENADSNEYCLQELEQKNKELRREIAELRKECNHCNFHTYRSALEEIKSIVLGQIDITDKDDELMCVFKSIIDKINEC